GYGLGAATVFVSDQLKPASSGAKVSVFDNTPGPAGSGATQAGGAQTPDLSPAPTPNLDQQMKPFWSTFQAIQNEFYGRPADTQKIIYGATKGMVQSLGDDYSVFLTPQEASLANGQLKGEQYAGIGAYVEKRNGVPIIAAPIPNTPAARAGLRSKDIIL